MLDRRGLENNSQPNDLGTMLECSTIDARLQSTHRSTNMTCKSPISRTCLALTIFSLFTTGFISAALSKAASTAEHLDGVSYDGVSQAVQSKFRLIRSISGSKGHEQGGKFV